jgi:hypothetical protein
MTSPSLVAIRTIRASRIPFGNRRVLSTAGGQEAKLRRLSLEEITAYCKHHGYIYPGSELYGSIGASIEAQSITVFQNINLLAIMWKSGTGYDYGPLGVALKRNVQEAWWKDFIDKRSDCVGIDTALLMNPKGWRNSTCQTLLNAATVGIAIRLICSLGEQWTRSTVCRSTI